MTRQQLAAAALMCLFAWVVFATQSGGTGFWYKFHGGVSVHGLAIMSRATPANAFVGNSRTLINADDSLRPEYFDRSPVFFSVLVGALINLTEDLPTKVFIARQVMNAVFVLTMLFAWLLLWRLSGQRLLALAIIALTFSGYWLLYYRDMIHFDQPGLLGTMVLLVFLADFKLKGRSRRRGLVGASLVAVGLGHAFPAFSVLGLWFVMEAAGIMVRRGLSLRERLLAISTHEATRLLALGLLWGTLLLGYNISVEALRRNIPLQETSIVDSVLRRQPLTQDGGLAENTLNYVSSWAEFVSVSANRLLRWFAAPWSASRDFNPGALTWPLLALALATILYYSLRQAPARRMLLLLTALSGPAWIIFMANLTLQHDYTMMYGLGFALVFWLAALGWLRRFPRALPILLLPAAGLFALSSQQVYSANAATVQDAASYTEEYERVRQQIVGRGRRIYDTFVPSYCPIHRDWCHTLGFYLGDNYIARKLVNADYLLSDRPLYLSRPYLAPDDEAGLRLLSRSLTPENSVAHLFNTADFETRYLPTTIAEPLDFGHELALGGWQLRDSVQVQPCQRVNVESWWQALRTPLPNYSLQIAITDSAGEAVGGSNARLGTVNSGVWSRDVWFLDVARLQLPCDAAPGEYSLVLSVYDPQTLDEGGPLPLMGAEDSAGDAWLYLTTLFIE